MIALCLMGLAWAGEPTALESAIHTEVERAMSGLVLPDASLAPHLGHRGRRAGLRGLGRRRCPDHDRCQPASLHACGRSCGLPRSTAATSRGLRSTTGLVLRGLGREDHPLALRRELWMALDQASGPQETYAAKQAARRGRDLRYTPDFAPAAPAVAPFQASAPADHTGLEHRILALSEAVAGSEVLEFNQVGGYAGDYRSFFYDTAGTRLWSDTRAGRPGHDAGRPRRFDAVQPSLLGRSRPRWTAGHGGRWPNFRTRPTGSSNSRRWDQRPSISGLSCSARRHLRSSSDNCSSPRSAAPPMESAPENASQDARPIPTSRIGRRLLPAGWRVIDDAQRYPELMGSMTYDYEGVATRAVTVVEDGVLRDVLMSRTPRSDRDQSTGHARGMAADRFEAMPTQVHISPKRARSWTRLKRQALAMARSAGLDHALLVKRLSPPSMEENLEFSVTGDEPMAGLTTPIEVVKLFADGREEPVRGLRFVGQTDAHCAILSPPERREAPFRCWMSLVARPLRVGLVRRSGGFVGGPAVLIDEMESARAAARPASSRVPTDPKRRRPHPLDEAAVPVRYA